MSLVSTGDGAVDSGKSRALLLFKAVNAQEVITVERKIKELCLFFVFRALYYRTCF
jgi:hypothetical protein